MKLSGKLAAPLLIATVFSALPAVAQNDIVIESRKEGKNNDQYSEPAGTWIDSNNPPTTAKSGASGLTPQGQIGSRKFLLKDPPTGDRNTVLAAARFAPKITTPGRYYVYSTWPKAGNATDVLYVVKHARGESIVPVTQDGFGYSGVQNANEWYLLGDYEFAPGAENYVEIRATGATKSVNPNPRDIGQIFADAVRFSTQPLSEGVTNASGSTGGVQPGYAPPASSAQPSAYQPAAPAPSAYQGGYGSASSAQLNWLDSIERGLQTAAREGKKIFVFFYSPEGNRSRRYEQDVFENPAVKPLLQDKFVLVRINLLENQQLASTMRVFKAGTINIYDTRGEGIDQITEMLEAPELAAKLRSY